MIENPVLRSRPLLLSGVLLLLAGCGSDLSRPDLAQVYLQEVRYHGVERNPVLVIPGVLGSRMVDGASGRVVWGAFAGDYADPETEDGSRLVGLPMREGIALAELRDGVRPTGVLDKLQVDLFGLPIELQAYYGILATLGSGGYRDEELARGGTVDYGDEHFTCFQFPYDWRRDNVENARLLHSFIRERREYLEREYERRYGVRKSIKFDVVAHSMGGLLLRYYLRYGPHDLPADGSLPRLTWEGSEYIERAVLVGTPNAGSTRALLQLVGGVEFSRFLPTYEPALLGTMPALYQLLPRPRHGLVVLPGSEKKPVGDFYDAELWQRFGWGLAAPEQDGMLQWLLPEAKDRETRARVALDHLRKCLARARHFAAAIDLPTAPPAGLSLYLVAGDAQLTPARVTVDPATGGLAVTENHWGDGQVIRSSTLMDERLGAYWSPYLKSPIHWTQVMFLPRDHLGMIRDPIFSNNVLYLLIQAPRGS